MGAGFAFFARFVLVGLLLCSPGAVVNADSYCNRLFQQGWVTTDCCPNDGKVGPTPVPGTCSATAVSSALVVVSQYAGGTIPSILGTLTSVTAMLFNANSLVNTIPTSLGLLTNLKALSFWANYMTGTIPAELGNLKALTAWVGGDNFSGPLDVFMQMTSLKELGIAPGRGFAGTIPTSIGNLSALTFFDMGNRLVGSLPPQFATLTNLKQLYAQYGNRLTGVITNVMQPLTALTAIYFPVNAGEGCPTNNMCGSHPTTATGLPACGNCQAHFVDTCSAVSKQLVATPSSHLCSKKNTASCDQIGCCGPIRNFCNRLFNDGWLVGATAANCCPNSGKVGPNPVTGCSVAYPASAYP